MPKIYVLHENNDWVAPLRHALAENGLPHEEWFLDKGQVNLNSEPPRGVFYNRMSASSHSRGHRHAAELTATVLAWLNAHGRRVVNTHRALQLEISKAAQYAALHAEGIRTPHTVAACGREEIHQAAGSFFPEPVILKPNRGGKGLGVHLFTTAEALRNHLDGPGYEQPLDGISLLQAYIQSPEPFIIRAEFIGGRFFYAVRVNTSQGFELCPADVCVTVDQPDLSSETTEPPFTILEGFTHPILEDYERFLARNEIEIAGIEFIRDAAGQVYTYDVNTNTNYNPEAEARAGVSGMNRIAQFLGEELSRLTAIPPVRPEAALFAGGIP